jgi:hypothetical protein
VELVTEIYIRLVGIVEGLEDGCSHQASGEMLLMWKCELLL